MNQQSNFDFLQPNFLNPKSFWLSVAKSLWQIGRGFFPLLVVLGIRREFNSEKWWYYLIPVVFILLAFVRAYINYKFFQFRVDNDELILQSGWLNKEQTVVKFDKIHEVNLNQKFLHKLLGLYNIGIDTAGSAKTEIEINGVSYNTALALKNVLVQKSTIEVSGIEMQEVTNLEEPIVTNASQKIEISFSSLIKIGITRNYLQTFGLLFAFGFQIIDQLEDVFYTKDESIYDDIYNKTSQFQVGFLWIALLFSLIVFVILFNLLRTVIAYYDYKIQLKEQQLLVSFGLTDSHIISVPANKVQLFQFQQNYFQRLMNLFEVKVKQVESSESNKKKKGLIIPGANYQELSSLFKVIYSDDLSFSSGALKPHVRKLVVKLVVLTFFLALVLAGIIYKKEYEFLWVPLVAYSLITALLYLGYRNEKLHIEEEFIVIKSGIWDITTTYLHISKVQQISITQSIFQKKRQIGSVTLCTAAGSINLDYYHFSTLQKLANEWLFQIEKNKYKWT